MDFITRMLGMSAPQEVPSEPKSGNPHDTLQLISFRPPSSSVASATPFCSKLELAMRLAGIEYKGYAGDITNATHAPKQKFPVLKHGSNVVCDSSCIFDYLVATYPDKMKMFSPPDAKTAAIALAVQRMLEEDLYFCLLYILWQRDDVWSVYGPRVFDGLVPPLAQPIIMPLARSGFLKGLWSQGIGRHSFEQVLERFDRTLQACEALVADSGAYLTGAEAVQADCFLFGFIEVVLNGHIADATVNPMRPLIEKCPGVMALYKRLRERAWPDGICTEFKEKFSAK